MKSKHHPLFVAALAFVAWIGVTKWDKEANALANPQTTGLNTTMLLPADGGLVRAPMYGLQCSVTMINNDVDAGSTNPVFTGYVFNVSDGGVFRPTPVTGVPICNASTCINTWVTRDSTPGAIYARVAAGTSATRIRVEVAGGCKSP